MTLVISPRWAWDAENGLREGVHVIVRDGRVADVVRDAPTLDAERITDFIEFFRVALANGIHVRMRVTLINGDELGSEAQSDDGNIDFHTGRTDFMIRLSLDLEPVCNQL